MVTVATASAALCAYALIANVRVSAEDLEQVPIYKTKLQKGHPAATMRELEPNYIPDKQCSGLITGLSCPPLAMVSLSVEVSDFNAYADVIIDNTLATAEVFRRPRATGDCTGEADVQVHQSCGGYRRERRTERSALRRALPPVA